MPLSIKPNGEFTVVYSGPYGGFHTMAPENLISDNFSPATNDFWFRNAELRTRPVFAIGVGANPPVANAKVMALGNLGSLIWAVALGNGLYTTSNGGSSWTLVPGSAATSSSYISARVFGGVLYIASGSHLSSYDGTTFTLDLANLAAGPTNIGAAFLDELDNHLIMANTSEHTGASTTLFGNRLRWSATSLPAQWDATANVNAGFQDFLDVPDGITGFMALGRVGYLLRTDGITEIAPTGRGTAPFEFNHLWASQNGIGNIKFYGQAQYGTTGVIIARDNIYSVVSYQIQPIGGGARDQIMNDMAFASAANGGAGGIPNIWGVITPYVFGGVTPDSVQPTGLGTGVITAAHLTYMLFLNIGNNCKIWVYSFEENNWTQWNLTNVNVTAKPQIVTNPVGQQALYVPYVKPLDGSTSIGGFNPAAFNDSQAASHSYRVEDVAPNMVPTVRRVILTYRDLGVVTVTATITGVNDNGALVIATQTQIIGTAGAPGTLKTAFFEPQDVNGRSFTGFRPQLTLSRAASAGPLSISTATMIGRLEMENL